MIKTIFEKGVYFETLVVIVGTAVTGGITAGIGLAGQISPFDFDVALGLLVAEALVGTIYQ